MTRSNRHSPRIALFLLGMAGLAQLLPFGRPAAPSTAAPSTAAPVTCGPAAPADSEPTPRPAADSTASPRHPALDRSTLPPGLDLDSLALLEGIASSLTEPIFSDPLAKKE